ncbi:MAG: alpha/beta hydrolase, partial [Marmoricola sp.]
PRVLAKAADDTGGAVSVVGWSLGGIFARELARNHPELVRQVVTLVSPFAMTGASRSHADRAFRRQSARHAGALTAREHLSRPVPVPSTAVFSRTDGIVAWRDCIQPVTAIHENVEVRSGHLGAGVDAAVMWLLADRLSLPEGAWRPFRAPTLLRPLFPGA